jgi:hypothetical protein
MQTQLYDFMNHITPKFTVFGFGTVAALVAAANLFASCIAARPRLNKADVIAIADRVVVKNGYSLGKFKKRAQYNFVRKDNTWVVFYNLKPDSHGMVPTGFDFTVHVKDDTRETWFIPGR